MGTSPKRPKKLEGATCFVGGERRRVSGGRGPTRWDTVCTDTSGGQWCVPCRIQVERGATRGVPLSLPGPGPGPGASPRRSGAVCAPRRLVRPFRPDECRRSFAFRVDGCGRGDEVRKRLRLPGRDTTHSGRRGRCTLHSSSTSRWVSSRTPTVRGVPEEQPGSTPDTTCLVPGFLSA